ncbi:MAG TPA: amidohydrolase [Gemmatimonadota bacterium]|nr:amidohydrolase [Gemmatimonadota bacterium]
MRFRIGRGLLAVVLTAAPAALCVTPAGAQEPADRIVTNGVIHTMDGERPRAEAMAIADGEIVGLGASGEILDRFRGAGTVVLDLQGRTVIPGLIDAHGHLGNLGELLRTLDLAGTASPADVAERVRIAAAEREDGAWIVGRGWDQNDWAAKEFPTHEPLDEAAPEHPVYLRRVDGHAVWLNARALDLAGITADAPDPPGGRILRDAAGRPTGVLIDNAEDLVEPLIEPDGAERAARLAAAQAHIVALGLTGVHDMGAARSEIELYRAWADSGRLLPRIVAYMDSDEKDLLAWWVTGGGAEIGEDGDRFRVRGVKLYADGALGSRGAALMEPYSDDPENEGLLVTPPDSLAARTARVLRLGLQPAIHAIGDRGNRVALDAIEEAMREVTPDSAGPIPRIEHAQVIALEDIPGFAGLRFDRLGVIASVQPTHATSDMYWAEERVGPQRIAGAYAWQKLRAAGVPLACGSDFPVESANPFYGLYAAVSRRDQEGWPEGGWYPEERLTREQALACFTIWAARAAGMEDEVGSLEVGKRADFLVLDRDPMEVPADEIWRTSVLETVIDGETVFEALPREGATSTFRFARALFARVGEPLPCGGVPQRAEIAVDPLLGAGLVERRDRSLPDPLIEQLQRPALAEPCLLQLGCGENLADRALDLFTVRHRGGEAIRWRFRSSTGRISSGSPSSAACDSAPGGPICRAALAGASSVWARGSFRPAKPRPPTTRTTSTRRWRSSSGASCRCG